MNDFMPGPAGEERGVPLPPRLAAFVNRESEVIQFEKMLNGQGKAVTDYLYVLLGEGGLGKSLLMARMSHACAVRGTPSIEVPWSDFKRLDALAVMRRVRDHIGAQGIEAFNEFTRLVNNYTTPRASIELTVPKASIANNLTAINSVIGDIAVVKDFMLESPRPDISIPEEQRIIDLSDAFLRALEVATRHQCVVLFFDAIEKMSDVTARWLWGELVSAVRDAKLPNVRLVLFGRARPAIDELRDAPFIAEMHPLGPADIDNYLIKRGLTAAQRLVLTPWLVANTQGRPLQVANQVDAYLALLERQSKDN